MMAKTYDRQTAKFLAVVGENMPELPGEIMQGWIQDPRGLQEVLRQALVPTEKKVSTSAVSYAVSVDYSRSLEEMVRAGHYDLSNPNITSENFPHDKSRGKVEVKIELVHLDRHIGSGDEVLSELDSIGYRPATLPELLALGARHQDLQRKIWIAGLGSVWRDPDGVPFVACLDRRTSGHSLILERLKSDWVGFWLFAAVRK